MLGTSEQTSKISKTGFAKIGHTAISKPQWVGFSSKKTCCRVRLKGYLRYKTIICHKVALNV